MNFRCLNAVFHFNVLLFFVSTTFAQNGAADAQSVFARVQKQYGESESIRAQFFTRMPGDANMVRGTLLVKRGNKFRLDMSGRTVVCNGQTVWNYDHNEKKVVISTFKNNPATVSPEKIFLGFPKTYKPTIKQESASEGRLLRLVLTPSSARDAVGGMQEVTMRLVPETLKLKELLISDGSATYQWTMTELIINAGLKDVQFEYTIPNGAQVVDLRD